MDFVINEIKLNLLKKKKIVVLKKYNKNTLNILNILISFNIIRYVILKNNKLLFKIKTYKNNKLLFKINNLYKKSNFRFLKFKNLIKINQKNLILILSTNKGILNNFYAKNKKIGGLVLFQI